ncbi:hypothetical protein USB125703_00550 [Pseudoclavibacter triregionum]|nr:hypothetical protein USB125703_00550 [Pseudoclavibacter triregionum]
MPRNVIIFSAGALAAVTALSLGLVALVGPEAAAGLAVLGMPVPALIAILVELGSRGLEVERAAARTAPRPKLSAVFATGGSPRRVWVGILLALVALLGVLGAQLLVAPALGIVDVALPADPAALGVAIAVQFAIMLLAATGEELGWRGWLHTRLRPRGLVATTVVTAGLWVAFHVPFLAVTGAMSGWQWAAALGSIAFSSVLLTALRERAGSVWPAVVGHAILNSLVLGGQQAFAAVPTDGPGMVGFQAVAWAGFLVAAAILLRTGRREAAPAARGASPQAA